MSGALSRKPQSEKELKTTRTLNTLATIGAGHALYSMIPEKKRADAGEKLLNIVPEKTRPATAKFLSTLKQPELGGKLTTAGKVVAGGWLGLHGAELVGDVMARRSINNQLAQAQAQKNKGSVGSVKKNDQSMISKADGSVSRNGHGKSLTYASNTAIGAGTGATVAGAGLTGVGYQTLRTAKKHKGMKAIGHAGAGMNAINLGAKTAGVGGGLAATGLGLRAYKKHQSSHSDVTKADKESKFPAAYGVAGGLYGTALGGYMGNQFGDGGFQRSLARASSGEPKQPKPKREGLKGLKKTNREYKKMMRANGLMPEAKSVVQHGKDAKKFAGKNKYAIGGGAALGTLSAMGGYAQGKEAVNKGLNSAGREILYGGKRVGGRDTLALRVAAHNQGKKNAELMAWGAKYHNTRGIIPKDGVGRGTTLKNAYRNRSGIEVEKAYRRFDPEADRQRRLGLYAGTGVGGSIVAGREAARNFETKVVSGSGAKATTHRGLYAKPGKGKKGLGLAAVAAASGALGVGSYKRGISQRNQPWT